METHFIDSSGLISWDLFKQDADYQHLDVYVCRILVPSISDIYPVEDLHIANNAMAIHLHDTIMSLPDSHWQKEDYLLLLAQIDDEGFDDFTRVRELLGIVVGSSNGWSHLRIGELVSVFKVNLKFHFFGLKNRIIFNHDSQVKIVYSYILR